MTNRDVYSNRNKIKDIAVPKADNRPQTYLLMKTPFPHSYFPMKAVRFLKAKITDCYPEISAQIIEPSLLACTNICRLFPYLF